MIDYFNYAGYIAAIIIAGIAFSLVPTNLWDGATIASILVLSLSVGLIVSAPNYVLGHGKTKTASLASIGSIGTILALSFFFSLLSFALATQSVERKYVWSTTLLSIGVLTVGIFISRGAFKYIDATFPDQKPILFRKTADRELQMLLSMAGSNLSYDLNTLIDNLTYSPSDITGIAENEQHQILSLIKNDLTKAIKLNDKISCDNAAKKISQLIMQRQALLNEARKITSA